MKQTAHFGDHLRAARLGFRWVDRLQAFVQMADGPEELIAIRCIPPGHTKAMGSHGDKLYRCWWEGEEGLGFVDRVPILKGITRLKKPWAFLVDDAGEYVRDEIPGGKRWGGPAAADKSA